MRKAGLISGVLFLCAGPMTDLSAQVYSGAPTGGSWATFSDEPLASRALDPRLVIPGVAQVDLTHHAASPLSVIGAARRNHWRGALYGLALGTLVGVGYGLYTTSVEPDYGAIGFFTIIVTAPAGALVGALIGTPR
jgi:hypothetical protein